MASSNAVRPFDEAVSMRLCKSSMLSVNGQEFSVLVETDEKEFVLGIAGLEKLDRSLFGLAGFVGLLSSD